MQLAAQKKGTNSSRYMNVSHSPWRGSQNTSRALKGRRWASRKPPTALTPKAAA